MSSATTRSKRVHVHDLHATMLLSLGIDHERLTYRYQGRDFRLTDVAGHVVKDIVAAEAEPATSGRGFMGGRKLSTDGPLVLRHRSGSMPGRPLRPRKMLKNGLHRVTALRNHPDASDLRAAPSVVDLLHGRNANIVPRW